MIGSENADWVFTKLVYDPSSVVKNILKMCVQLIETRSN